MVRRQKITIRSGDRYEVRLQDRSDRAEKDERGQTNGATSLDKEQRQRLQDSSNRTEEDKRGQPNEQR